MKSATRVYAATFGVIMALAGVEHGIGEILQGNVAPEGIMILSWPEAEFFRNLGGEPAMTVVPNLLLTGILAVVISLALLVWSLLFVNRKNGGLIMMLLSSVMLLVGGGIFPPVFAMLTGLAASRMYTTASSLKAQRADGWRHVLARLWPWSYAVCVLAWPAVFPVGYFWGEKYPAFLLVVLFIALGTLLLSLFASFAYDRQKRVDAGTYLSTEVDLFTEINIKLRA
jgi:hypothetical protein